MKTTSAFLFIASLFLFPSFVLAQGKSNQVQNQIQVETKNQGEDQQLEVNTQEQEASGTADQDETSDSSNRSENARQQVSIVAQEVEQLLETREDKVGIGQQVKEIAQQQGQAQQETADHLDQLESRKGWLKKLIGPDQKAIKNLTRQMEQNRIRIKKLEQLQTQVPSQADQEQIQEVVQAMTEQNTALSNQLQAEEEVGSLFGWLIKYFVK